MSADPKHVEAVRKGAPSCPKCGLEAKTLLHRFCQHKTCPVREALAKPEDQ